MTAVHSAATYRPCDDLWVVTAYFNPAHYQARRALYHTFAETLQRSGLHLLTVECAFGDDPFELPPGPEMIHVRGRDIMWQRERLLNIGIGRLPAAVKKVAWLDCELLFSNPDWALETARQLDQFPVVQPFERVIWLAPGKVSAADGDRFWPSFGYVRRRNPDATGMEWETHGHTGFGWAYHRELLDRHGLYDANIGGSGDHLMAHAMVGDFDAGCMQYMFSADVARGLTRPSRGRHIWSRFSRPVRRLLHGQAQRGAPEFQIINEAARSHFLAWARPFYTDVQGKVGYTPGVALHLWHGSLARREYVERRALLNMQAFDPARDIRLGESDCWEWASDKPLLHAWLRGHFERRQEDEDTPLSVPRPDAGWTT